MSREKAETKEGLGPPAAGSLCEVCGRAKDDGRSAYTEACAAEAGYPDEDHFRLGYEREKARADAAENALRTLHPDLYASASGQPPARPSSPPAPPEEKWRCTDDTPSWYSGHWREWHRGHGCEKDPNRAPPAQGQGATKELPRAAAQDGYSAEAWATWLLAAAAEARRMTRPYFSDDHTPHEWIVSLSAANADAIAAAIRLASDQPRRAPDSPPDSAPLEGLKDSERAAAPHEHIFDSQLICKTCGNCALDLQEAEAESRRAKQARLTKKAHERAAEFHSEKPPKKVGPRCSAKTRKGNPCVMASSTKCGLCLTHAASAWDRYQSRDRAAPAAPPADIILERSGSRCDPTGGGIVARRAPPAVPALPSGARQQERIKELEGALWEVLACLRETPLILAAAPAVAARGIINRALLGSGATAAKPPTDSVNPSETP